MAYGRRIPSTAPPRPRRILSRLAPSRAASGRRVLPRLGAQLQGIASGGWVSGSEGEGDWAARCGRRGREVSESGAAV